jgi:magnesium transporter
MAVRDGERIEVARRVLEAASGDTVAAVLGRLPGSQVETPSAVFVVDAYHRFTGAIRLERLLAADPGRRLEELVDPDWPAVLVTDDPEKVATEAVRHAVASVAVVDQDRRLHGAIPPEALLAILRREHVEDLHRLAGIQYEEARTRQALEEPPARRARHRLPWLLVGLAGSMVAAAIVSRFERVLADRIAVAFFVPTIVYLADAIGTQTEAIVVRGLSLSRRSLRSLLGGEVRTGLFMGLALGAIAVPLVTVLFADAALAAAVGVAIFVAGGAATTVGLLLPWALQRLGSDPALGSGPVATVIQDLLSLLIYFITASLMIART